MFVSRQQSEGQNDDIKEANISFEGKVRVFMNDTNKSKMHQCRNFTGN
jgi:hypothetical protein